MGNSKGLLGFTDLTACVHFMYIREETNVIEASANGATVAGKTVVAVVVNYIGFLGLLGFINATLKWIGGNVGFDDPGLSFEVKLVFKEC